MQTPYFSPKASKTMHKYAFKYVNMHTQIHASLVSKINAFPMNFFGYFNLLKFPILLETIIDLF